MGNDFPDSAWSTEELANTYVAKVSALTYAKRNREGGRLIYWRVWPFDVDLTLMA